MLKIVERTCSLVKSTFYFLPFEIHPNLSLEQYDSLGFHLKINWKWGELAEEYEFSWSF